MQVGLHISSNENAEATFYSGGTSIIVNKNNISNPHKLKPTKAGVYPIVTKICAAIGDCAQQPAILTRTCGGVAQCSGDLRDNGRELHGNVKAS